MNSAVAICNLALARVATESITALTDSSKQARLCNNLFQHCLDMVLLGWDWVCAREQASLTADATAPTHTWDYRYLLPASPYCLRLLSVKDSDGNDVEYALKGRYILCDIDDGLDIDYTKRITAYTEMPEDLTQAVAMRLAQELLSSFTWTAARKAGIDKDLEEAIIRAKWSGAAQDYSTDEKENSVTYGGNSEWVDAGR